MNKRMTRHPKSQKGAMSMTKRLFLTSDREFYDFDERKQMLGFPYNPEIKIRKSELTWWEVFNLLEEVSKDDNFEIHNCIADRTVANAIYELSCYYSEKLGQDEFCFSPKDLKEGDILLVHRLFNHLGWEKIELK